ncbi:MAG: hypothetical protein Q4F31_07675 [Eubacteriales bacterium]|nr:hypothetical protein [Eubacteriales bacterium]
MSEDVLRGLRWEREEELENLIEQDEHPEYVEREPDTDRKMLKRDLKAEALHRLEVAARSEKDFINVIELWDKRDANRERKERYHEIPRNKVPLEYGMTYDGILFPESSNNSYMKAVRSGNILDILFDCPYEIDELVSDKLISKALKELKPEHKEILHFLLIRNYSTAKLGNVRCQTDRNIRKVYATVIKKIRRRLIAAGRMEDIHD